MLEYLFPEPIYPWYWLWINAERNFYLRLYTQTAVHIHPSTISSLIVLAEQRDEPERWEMDVDFLKCFSETPVSTLSIKILKISTSITMHLDLG